MSSYGLSYLFGIKDDVRGGLAYVEETEVVFACGHHIVRMDTDAMSKTQRLVAATPRSKGIDAMAVCASRNLTAFAETQAGHGPIITVHDWQPGRRSKRRQIHSIDFGCEHVHSLAFSSDGRYLLVLGGAPERRLHFVLWEKSRLVGSSPSVSPHGKPVYKADGHPNDPSAALVSGDGVFRLYRLSEDVVRPIAVNLKQDPKHFLSHVWLPNDRSVAATDQGELLLMEGTEFKKVLDTSPNDGNPIDCLEPFSKGFIAGCDGGKLRIYEKADEARHFYKLKAEFAIPGDSSRFRCIAVSPSEEELSCVMVSGQAYVFRLANYELHKPDDIVFAPLVTPLHGPNSIGDRSIVGLDTSARKPLFVTAGADRTVRIWSHMQLAGGDSGLQTDMRPDVELVKRFSEELYGVAFHPSGFHILVGFESGLQLMNVLMEDIRPVKDFPIRKCIAVKFAHGGEYFAAANGSTISIFETYTATNVSTLRAHNDKVLSLSWSADDRYLVSASKDGTVIRWNASSGKIVNHEEVRGSVITSVDASASRDGSRVFVVGTNVSEASQSPFRILDLVTPSRRSSKSPRREETHETELFVDPGTVLGHVATSSDGKLLVAGTVTKGRLGAVRLYSRPLPEEEPDPPFREIVCHAGPVTHLHIALDSRLLISTGIDGTIALFRPEEMVQAAEARIGGGGRSEAAGTGAGGSGSGSGGGIGPNGQRERWKTAMDPAVALGDLPWAEEILVTRSALEGSREQRERLKAAVNDVKLQNSYNMTHRKIKNEEKMEQIEEKYKEELEVERQKLEVLRDEKADMESRFDREVGELEDQQTKELDELATSYKNKMAAEIERYDALVQQRDERDAQWEKDIQAMSDEHRRRMEELESQFESEIAQEQQLIRELGEEQERMRRDIAGKKDSLEDGTDRDMDRMKLHYERRLHDQQQITRELTGANAILRERQMKLTHEKEEKTAEIQRKQEQERSLKEQIASLRKDVAGHQKEIREREDTLSEKNSRIDDLRKKNQELDKFKFVLNYKIQELQRQIAPRQREIRQMREQLREMELELMQYEKSNAALNLMIGELRLKKQGLEREVEELLQQEETLRKAQEVVERELFAVAQQLDDYSKLHEGVVALYRKYVHEDLGATPLFTGDDPVAMQEEQSRQRSHLERSVDSLKQTLAKDASLHRSDRQRLMRENTLLTREVNELRRELHFMVTEGRRAQEGIPDTTEDKGRLSHTGRGRTLARFGLTGGIAPIENAQRTRVVIRARADAAQRGDAPAPLSSSSREHFGEASDADDGGIMGMMMMMAEEDGDSGRRGPFTPREPGSASRPVSSGSRLSSSRRRLSMRRRSLGRKSVTDDAGGEGDGSGTGQDSSGGGGGGGRLRHKTARPKPNPVVLRREAQMQRAQLDSLLEQLEQLRAAVRSDVAAKKVLEARIGEAQAERVLRINARQREGEDVTQTAV